LAALVDRALPTVGAVTEAAREVLSWGNEAALVTLGSHGALLVTEQKVLWARGPRVRARSTVGAGDSALAGFLSREDTPPERLRQAVAWGTAAVALPGTTVPRPDDVAMTPFEIHPTRLDEVKKESKTTRPDANALRLLREELRNGVMGAYRKLEPRLRDAVQERADLGHVAVQVTIDLRPAG
jgi:hypothetical protein